MSYSRPVTIVSKPAPVVPIRKRQFGTVKWYAPDRGFGFIRGDSGAEYFIGERAVHRGLGSVIPHPGMRLSFVVIPARFTGGLDEAVELQLET